MQAYSQDLRERVLRALARGDSPTEIARRFAETGRMPKGGVNKSRRVKSRIAAVRPAAAHAPQVGCQHAKTFLAQNFDGGLAVERADRRYEG